MPCPGKALGDGRQQGVDLQCLGRLPLYIDAAALWDQYLQSVGLITQRRGNTPHHQLRMPAPQACQCQLQLHAALIADQFVPFIHDDHAQVRQAGFTVGTGQHQGQAFRSGDQSGGLATGLARAFTAAGITGAQAHAPRNLQRLQWGLQGACGVGGQGAHRRDPQDRQRLGRRFAFACGGRAGDGETVEGGKPQGIGFTRPGAGMQ